MELQSLVSGKSNGSYKKRILASIGNTINARRPMHVLNPHIVVVLWNRGMSHNNNVCVAPPRFAVVFPSNFSSSCQCTISRYDVKDII